MPRIIIRETRSKHDKANAEYYVPDESHDFHTEFGSISKEQLSLGGMYDIGKERVRIFPATFIDRYARLKRGAQIIGAKDIGMIIAETGIGRDSTILEIGFGSGALTAQLARIAKKVYAYEIVQKNIEIGLRNLEELETPKHYDVKLGDAYDERTIAQSNEIDIFVLDVPEPWRALGTARKALKNGGWLVAYVPCITQANELEAALGSDFSLVKCCELIEREWKIAGNAVRPVTKDFSHTAFLVFLRKVA